MNLGGSEILVIIVVAILVLGPDKLPGALRMFGRAMGEVRKYQDMAKNEIEKAMNMPDVAKNADNKDEQESPNPEEPTLKKKSQPKPASQQNDEIVKPILDEED